MKLRSLFRRFMAVLVAAQAPVAPAPVLPAGGRSHDGIPEWPHRRSYRAQQRNRNGRRNRQTH